MNTLKKLLLVLAVFTVIACGSTVANATFGFDFSNGVVCGGTVQKDCYDHFEAGSVSGTTFTTLGNISIPAVSTTGLTSISGSFQVPNWGAVTLGVIMVAKDSNGGRVTSDPVTASAMLRPGAPVNLVIK